MIRYASVCDGISAVSVAWRSLGWECAWVSEIDPFACAVLAERWPDHHNVGDMLAIDERILNRGPVDILVGGTPCQSFSVAGLRGGLDDARGNLALRFGQLARLMRPKWVVWENVPGVLSSNGGWDFGAIVGALEYCGYGVAWRVLDAQFFGVPQRRRRVFVVGYLGNWRRSAAVLFDRDSLCGNPATRRKAGTSVAGALTRRIDRGGVNSEGHDNHLIVGTVSAKWAKGTGGPSGDECQNLVAFDTTQITSPYNYSSPVPGGPCHPLASRAHPPAIAYQCQGSNVGPMGTLRAGNGNETGGVPFVPLAFQTSQSGVRIHPTHATLDANNGSRRHNGTFDGKAVRRLTPRECERLQGFPDQYTLVTYRGKPAADGPRYRAIGNSMAVPVMRWIGERIAFVDQIEGVGS